MSKYEIKKILSQGSQEARFFIKEDNVIVATCFLREQALRIVKALEFIDRATMPQEERKETIVEISKLRWDDTFNTHQDILDWLRKHEDALNQPILISEKNYVLDGRHRCIVHARLGHTTIKAIMI